jgi:hypothetical protein
VNRHPGRQLHRTQSARIPQPGGIYPSNSALWGGSWTFRHREPPRTEVCDPLSNFHAPSRRIKVNLTNPSRVRPLRKDRAYSIPVHPGRFLGLESFLAIPCFFCGATILCLKAGRGLLDHAAAQDGLGPSYPAPISDATSSRYTCPWAFSFSVCGIFPCTLSSAPTARVRRLRPWTQAVAKPRSGPSAPSLHPTRACDRAMCRPGCEICGSSACTGPGRTGNLPQHRQAIR